MSNIDMDKVYMRNAAESKELNIVFRYVNETLKIDREFNFNRQMDEQIEGILTRIQGNVQKQMEKKQKKKGKSNEPVVVGSSEINVKLYSENHDLNFNNLTFTELLDKNISGIKLRVVDATFDMVFNPPWILSLKLPKCMLAGFVVYPTACELQFAEREHSNGTWFKAKQSQTTEWEACGEGFHYIPTAEDIGYYLKFVVTPGNGKGAKGPVVEEISKTTVQAAPELFPFEGRHRHTPDYLIASNELRVVTYNLLADYYADSDYSRKTLFPYCPPKYLEIDYRKQLFIKEIVGYKADLICLQEVDQKIFDIDFKEILGGPSLNYHGIMAPKGTCAEGVAIFVRKSRFELVESQVLHLGSKIPKLPIFESLWNKIKINEQLASRICDRSTTLQTCLLKIKDTNRYILVANTHLYFHPDADHIRLLQMAFSITYVEHLLKEAVKDLKISNPQDIGLIFCGDFNSVPECGIYKLMTEQFVDKDFVDWRSNAEQAVSNVELTQPFEMASACGTPEFTNFTTLFAACLDYIFYQKDRFEVMQYVPLPTEEQLKVNSAIPSVVIPSDHVALIADLRFKTGSSA
ncbi:2',5'-phosphodiesterase 12 isoform X2 [Drosophila kikkawai]